MPPTATWIVVAVVAFDLVFIPLLIRAVVQGVWAPIARRFPPQPLAEESVRKDFQSYKIGLFNLSWSVHTTADEHHLHLEPARALRWLGMTPASIPWSAMRPKRTLGRRWAAVRVGATTIWGPRWALDMAFVDSEPDDPAR